MQEKFNEYLKNGLSEYDSQYLDSYDYVMLLSRNNEIFPYFANISYEYFIEFPNDKITYNSAQDVLNKEMKLTSSEFGIIYENTNKQFKVIAYNELKKNMLSK